MPIEQAVDHLREMFDVKTVIRLSDFFNFGEQSLFRSLELAYQSEYHSTQRIVVLQDCNDQYDYTDLPGLSVQCLQKHLSTLDISNFFVTVVSGNKDIANELSQARNLYSNDDCVIQHVNVDFPYVKEIKRQDTFCGYPWLHLYVGTDGNVLPCCMADHAFPMGSINTSPVADIYKSSTFNQLRSNMLSGLKSKECSYCYKREDAGLDSPRLKFNKAWAEQIKKINKSADGTIDEFLPVFLDLRLNNICNLKCRMCSGYFSSAIAREDLELFGNAEFVDNSLKLDIRRQGISDLLKYVPAAEEIYFAGGEPLLSEEHYVILHKLIESKNTSVRLTYNTNFTTLKYKNEDVLKLWNHFSNVLVEASIDATGSIAEYIRHGGKWHTIESNIKALKENCPHVKFKINSTVGFLNIENLIAYQKLNQSNLGEFRITTMVQPVWMTVTALPAHHKQRLDLVLNEHIKWCKQNGAISLANSWQHVLTYMWAVDNSFTLTEFKKLTTILDNARSENFKLTFPEFADIL